jgi:hypothetical protein
MQHKVTQTLMARVATGSVIAEAKSSGRQLPETDKTRMEFALLASHFL